MDPTAGDGILQISGGLRVAGSASASDTTSPYIYRTSGSDHLNIATSGSERLRITSAGLVGIGTNNPSGKLNIAGSDSQLLNLIQDSGDLAIRLNDRGTGSAYIKVPDNTSGSLAFETGGSERLRITSGGYVNIGGDYTQTSRKVMVNGGSNLGQLEV